MAVTLETIPKLRGSAGAGKLCQVPHGRIAGTGRSPGGLVIKSSDKLPCHRHHPPAGSPARGCRSGAGAPERERGINSLNHDIFPARSANLWRQKAASDRESCLVNRSGQSSLWGRGAGGTRTRTHAAGAAAGGSGSSCSLCHEHCTHTAVGFHF